MKQTTRTHNRFEYHTEDMDCKSCLNYKGKNKLFKNGCWEDKCQFDKERQEAVSNGRVKRKRGWFKSAFITCF